MKSVFFLSVLAISLAPSAMATPVVGDSASYDITIVQNGQSTAVDAVDAVQSLDTANDQFTSQMTLSENGQVVQQQNETDSLSQATQLEGVVSFCSSFTQNGAYDTATVEQVTVPAGTFTACHVTKAKQMDIFLGDVPFSIIKAMQWNTDGSTVAYSLTAFKKN
jgi:hypothetical protein